MSGILLYLDVLHYALIAPEFNSDLNYVKKNYIRQINVLLHKYYEFIELLNNLLDVATLSLNQSLSVLVQVQFSKNDLRWMNVERNRSTVRLFSL